MDKPVDGELELTGEERIKVWEAYKKAHPNPELIPESDFGYINRLLKAQQALTSRRKDEWYNKLLEDYKRVKADRASLFENLEAKDAEIRGILDRVETMLGLHEGELGFIEISNHVPYSEWERFQSRYQEEE